MTDPTTARLVEAARALAASCNTDMDKCQMEYDPIALNNLRATLSDFDRQQQEPKRCECGHLYAQHSADGCGARSGQTAYKCPCFKAIINREPPMSQPTASGCTCGRNYVDDDEHAPNCGKPPSIAASVSAPKPIPPRPTFSPRASASPR